MSTVRLQLTRPLTAPSGHAGRKEAYSTVKGALSVQHLSAVRKVLPEAQGARIMIVLDSAEAVPAVTQQLGNLGVVKAASAADHAARSAQDRAYGDARKRVSSEVVGAQSALNFAAALMQFHCGENSSAKKRAKLASQLSSFVLSAQQASAGDNAVRAESSDEDDA